MICQFIKSQQECDAKADCHWLGDRSIDQSEMNRYGYEWVSGADCLPVFLGFGRSRDRMPNKLEPMDEAVLNAIFQNKWANDDRMK